MVPAVILLAYKFAADSRFAIPFAAVKFVILAFVNNALTDVMFVFSKVGIVADVIKAEAPVRPVDAFRVAVDIFVTSSFTLSNVGIVAEVINAVALVNPTDALRVPDEMFVETNEVTVAEVTNAFVNLADALVIPVDTFIVAAEILVAT